MEYAVDLQGFMQPGNEFVLKEFASVPLQYNEDPVVHLFKPPFSWRRLTEKYKKKNFWLEVHHHGLDWNSGDIEYTNLVKYLRECLQDAERVYVIGEERKKWLARFKLNCIITDVTERGYNSYNHSRSVTVCTNHNGAHKIACAVHNAKMIKRFCLSNVEEMEWEDIPTDEEDL